MKWDLCCNLKKRAKENPFNTFKTQDCYRKKPQMSEKQMMKQMSSQLHNQ